MHDRDINLVRFGFRDYDPETGRWTAKDPIGFAGGDVDVFGYVQNDPVNWVDPSGESAMEAAIPLAMVISQLDTTLPGPMDVIAGAVLAGAWLLDHPPENNSFNQNNSEDGGSCPQDKKLSAGEIKKIKGAGIDPHDLKGGKNASTKDLFKDRQGNILVKPKNGTGPGDTTGININDL